MCTQNTRATKKQKKSFTELHMTGPKQRQHILSSIPLSRWHLNCLDSPLKIISLFSSIMATNLVTGINGELHSMDIAVKRSSNLINFSTFMGMGAFLLCLLFPVSPTPANSRDMAKALSSYSQHASTPTNHSHNPAFPHDDILAALTIYLEARGESFAGKMAVAAVIRNRMLHKYHSDGTVKGTVLRAKQFEPWIGRSPKEIRFNPKNKKMQESLLAWQLVQDGREIVDGAVLFYNPTLVNTPHWAEVYRKVAKIGEHEFFNKHLI